MGGIVALTASKAPRGATAGGRDHPGHCDRPNVPVIVSDDARAETVPQMPTTVLAAAGISHEAGDVVDGRSLLDGRRRERLLAEYWQDQANGPGIRDWAALRTAGWKYGEACP
jgi:hypothetical protein